ncbi:MAG TPA: hypothetical protein VGK73_02685 [Polyangiaceae bacterium]
MRAAAVILAFVAFGCDKKELCIGSPPPRCEGNVRAYCPGGWGTIDITRNRENCGSKFCGTFEDPVSEGAECLSSLGPCTESPESPRCVADERGGSVGRRVRCQNGQLLGVGELCDLPNEPDAGPSPSPDAGQPAPASSG